MCVLPAVTTVSCSQGIFPDMLLQVCVGNRMTLCLTDDYIIDYSCLTELMPPRSKRKRTSRVQTDIPDEDNAPGVVSVPSEDDEGFELDTAKPELKEESVEANPQLEVEAELWDSFREEFHEGMRRFCSIILRLSEPTAVEQLPLYLHRTYALLRELDEQVTGKPLIVFRYKATYHDCLL